MFDSNKDDEPPSFQECDSRLRIATKYEFTSIRRRTILQLLTRWPKVAYTYADFLVLGRNNRSRELLVQGYLMAWRAYPLSQKEGARVASEDLVWVMQLGSLIKNTNIQLSRAAAIFENSLFSGGHVIE